MIFYSCLKDLSKFGIPNQDGRLIELHLVNLKKLLLALLIEELNKRDGEVSQKNRFSQYRKSLSLSLELILVKHVLWLYSLGPSHITIETPKPALILQFVLLYHLKVITVEEPILEVSVIVNAHLLEFFQYIQCSVSIAGIKSQYQKFDHTQVP